ncbi:hypothetical protein DM01DRAFT_299453 [Hesseltinella vesiculosa]|uniref:Ribosome biogenesis protein SLX9 n=1 Tax=Hesseltinella vesiculosa TaxID=101127 RepID=A0A1X2GW48_9FUNG|nr:hypothetical protein DM01DRAFT_299453 [Hesseltinella vesiculosa]
MPKVNRKRSSTAKPSSSIASTTKSTISKTDKKKQRHSAWLEKLDHAYTVKKKQERHETRQTALQKGGFDDMDLVLQGLDATKETTAPTPSPTGSHLVSLDKIKSKNKKKNAMLQDIARFQKVLQHDAFKNDPLSTIRQHVQNTFK